MVALRRQWAICSDVLAVLCNVGLTLGGRVCSVAMLMALALALVNSDDAGFCTGIGDVSKVTAIGCAVDDDGIGLQ